MLAARTLLRRQPLRLLSFARTNASLAAATGGLTPPQPPPAPTKPTTAGTTGVTANTTTPSLAKSAIADATKRNNPRSAASPAASPGDTSTTATSAEPATKAKSKHKSSRNKTRLARKREAFTRALRASRRRWRAPVAKGELPVYDQAVRYIALDAARLRAELGRVRGELAEVAGGEGAEAEAEAAKQKEADRLRKKVEVLEVQSEVNRPIVRWMAFQGRADLKRPVYRHLLEQRWRKYGTLDLLMERVYQMNVVPDVLPVLRPSIDLQLAFPEAPPQSVVARTRRARKYKTVEPGVYLLPEQTRRPPRMTMTVFHPETRYYTLLMVDPDVPDPARRGFTTYLHWLQPNIALRAGKTVLQPHPHTGYVPPHPQRGTAYHRYTLLLLPHGSTAGEPIRVAHIGEGERRGFDVRAFCEKYGLDGGLGGGVHMWREVWDATVSDIYKHTLKMGEPRFGQPCLAQRAEEGSGGRKYGV